MAGHAAAAALLALCASAAAPRAAAAAGAAAAARDAGFDVRVKLRASWPSVPKPSADLEWAKGLGAAAALEALWRHASGHPDAFELPLDPASASFRALQLANGFLSPAVEAQRAACRALGAAASCGGAPLAVLPGTAAAPVACDPAALEAALEGAPPAAGAASAASLSVDLALYDDAFGGNATAVVVCGCVQDERLAPWLAWARSRRPGQGGPVSVAFRQADCPEAAEADLSGELLSGYAVELRIKSGEYKAADDATGAGPAPGGGAGASASAEEDSDDEESAAGSASLLEGVEVSGLRFGTLAARFPGLGSELLRAREVLEAEGAAQPALQRWELEDLGLRLAQRAARSPEPLRTLAAVTDNFPATMATLARQTEVRPRWRRALKKLREMGLGSHEEEQMREFNGAPLVDADLTLFPILERLAPQASAAARLVARLGPEGAAELARLQRGGLVQTAPPERLDWRHGTLRWCYHVRNDEETEDWPQRLSALANAGDDQDRLMGSLMAPPTEAKLLEVQQPVFTIVYVFDPTDAPAVDFALELVGSSRPARVALVAASAGDLEAGAPLAQAVAHALAWILKDGAKASASAARGFLQALRPKLGAGFSREDVEAALTKHMPKKRKADGSLAKAEAAAAAGGFGEYTRLKGLPVPSVAVNGRVAHADSLDDLRSQFKSLLSSEANLLRSAVQSKRLKDAKKIKDGEKSLEQFFLDGAGGAVTSTYDQVLTPGLRPSADAPANDPTLEPPHGRLHGMAAEQGPAGVVSPIHGRHATFLQQAELEKLPVFRASDAVVDTSFVVFLLRAADVALLAAFAEHLAAPAGVRCELRVVVSPRLGSEGAPCAPLGLRSCLAGAAGALEGLRRCSCSAEASGSGASDFEAEAALWRELPREARAAAAGSSPSGAVVVCNGLVVPSTPPHHAAPGLLAAHWCPQASPALPVHAAALAAAAAPPRSRSGMLTRCAAEVPRALRLHMPPREADLPVLASVAAVVDPLGETTTAFVHLVHLLHASLNVEVCIAMNPRETYDDYPLKKWQRHVFSSGSAKFPGPDRDELSAVFSRLQTHHTLTLAMVCPASWLVTAHKSEHDLDNIRAGDATRLGGPGSQPTVAAEFLLSRLYVEGSAHVRDSGKPATGLQLELQPTLAGPAGGHGGAAGGCGGADTRVMQNHGFWSMPICPGAFVPSLMPGASNDTFVLGSVIPIEVSSFAVPRLPLQVAVRPGRQEADLERKTLGAGARRRARWRRRRAAPQAAAAGPDAGLPTIHVFSLASGHLYERLLSVMVLSVRNHTRHPLHFWIVGDFLSPRFLDTLPTIMANLDSVSFDLVSFKWPSWLNPQKEKQRLIWAYKILFLDVLFPMDVPRVIFIDSDLTVRADIRELWEMDLQGRAYAFTPFCSGSAELPDGTRVSRVNNETTGYRFWESGYWAGHLSGSPYHISALFVVDLLEFRRQSVGDKLRTTYNSLTRDPGSLANLDQDLPNYAQFNVPIFSLPQEWLWCESWCSQETKPLAKAIDLCQNPKTKEPKTDMARRVIAEWDGYHRRALALQDGRGGGAGAPPRAAGGREEL